MSKDSSNHPSETDSLTNEASHKNRKNLGRPYAVIFKTVLIFMASQFLAYFLLLAGYSLKLTAEGLNPTYETIQNRISNDFDHSVATQFISILLAEGLIVLLVWLVLKKRNLGFGAIGLGRLPKFRDIKSALLGFGAYYVFFIIFGSLLIFLVPDLDSNQQQDVGFTEFSTAFERFIGLIGLVIIPPIAEEVLMRGYLYSGLRKFWAFFPSMVVTSLLFGAAHLLTGVGPGLLWLAGIQTFVLSVVLVYMREKTGALYAGILVHSLNNLIAFFVHFRS